MSIQEIVEQIKRKFDSSASVVLHPDHPFSFYCPDILIGYNQNLFGVFIRNKEELSNRNKVLTRLAFCRLVYPANFQSILFSEVFEGEFLHSIDNIKDLLKILKNSNPENIGVQIEVKIIQRNIFTKQSIVYAENLKYIKSINDFYPINIDINSAAAERAKYKPLYNKDTTLTCKSNIYTVKESIFGFKHFVKNSADLQSFYDYFINSQFSLQNRIPVPSDSNDINLKILDVNKIPMPRFDPLKTIRVSSLSGWFILNINNIDDALICKEKFQEKIDERYKKQSRYN